MILIDYSQIALASVFEFSDELKGKNGEEFGGMLRHLILNSIVSYKRKFKSQYGKLVITCDSKNYWRNDYFPYYKAGRKAARDASELDWDMIFAVMNGLKEDIKNHFPWTLIEYPRAEADDVIGVLVKWTQENEIQYDGLYDSPQENVIVASDGDNQQLTAYDNTAQFCPRKKALIPQLGKEALRRFKLEHVVKGDSADGIPNIFMPEDFLVNGEGRQKSVTAGILETFYTNDLDDVWEQLPRLKVDSTTEFKRNGTPKQVEESDDAFDARIQLIKARYKQNETIVLYENIPDHITNGIISTYVEYKPGGTKNDVMNYLIANGCQRLISDLQDF